MAGTKRRRMTSRRAPRRKTPFKRSRRGLNRLYKGIPNKMVITHKYCEQHLLTTGAAGAIDRYTWRANGMYDPNQSGTGHQPMLYDDMVAMGYDKWCVIGSKIKVVATKPDTVASVVVYPTTVALTAADEIGAGYALTTVLEQPFTKHVVLGHYNKSQAILTKTFSAKKSFGKAPLSDNLICGSPTGDPAQVYYYSVYVDSSTSATATAVLLDIEIEYTAVWFSRGFTPAS